MVVIGAVFCRNYLLGPNQKEKHKLMTLLELRVKMKRLNKWSVFQK